MATTLSGVSFSTTKVGIVVSPDSVKARTFLSLNHPWKRVNHRGRMFITMAEPDLSAKVTQSITEAQQVCADDPISGECAAAWDEVEEVSAAASDARLKKKESESDPLENFCKDNPETEECRTYED